jgi:hypothetical protein
MINGLSYLMEQGKIRDGDTIGHIWVDSAYGANGLRGAQYFADKHHLTVRDAKVSATDSDLLGVPDAAVPGGIRQVKPLFMAPEARSYAAPHQSGA